PDQLGARVPVDLEALDVAAAAAAPVLDDEEDQRALDEDEDERREAEDHVVGVVDPVGVRRVRVRWGEASVRGHRDSGREKRQNAREKEEKELPAHGR